LIFEKRLQTRVPHAFFELNELQQAGDKPFLESPTTAEVGRDAARLEMHKNDVEWSSTSDEKPAEVSLFFALDD
jgi:hypothetical protein